MTNLTEQWKKGELPSGLYYCNTENGTEVLKTWVGLNKHINLENMNQDVFISVMDDCEVLAEVPSYDEYMTMKDCVKKEFEAVEKYTKYKEQNEYLKAEIGAYKRRVAELKELLHECVAHLSLGREGASVTPINILIAKIYEVLK